MGSRVLSTLALNFVARTAQLNRGFEKIERRVGKFSTRLASGIAKVGALGGALTGVAGVAGFGFLLKQEAAAIDQTAKFAQRLGESTKELTRYRFTANLAGIANQAFDLSIQRVTRRAAEAAQGTGEAVKAFEELNIDAAEFTKLPLGQKLEMLAKRFANITQFGDKVRLAFKLFDTEGVSMVQLLTMGAKKIREMARRADKLGISFSNLSAARVEEMNDRLIEMRMLSKGVARTLLIEFAPVVTELINRFIEAGIAGEGIGAKTVNAVEQISKALARATQFVRLLGAGWFAFKGIVENVSGIVVQGLARMGLRVARLLKLVNINRDTSGFMADLSVGLKLRKAAEMSFAKSAKLLGSFDPDRAAGKVGRFFEQVRENIRQREEAAPRSPMSTQPSSSGTREVDPFGARAINLKDTFIGALNQASRQEQRVFDPQLSTTNTLLERIADNVSGAGEPVVV